MTTNQNTAEHHPSPDAPVSASAAIPTPLPDAAGARPYTKVTAHKPNFNEAPAGLRPIGGVLAGIIAGLPIPDGDDEWWNEFDRSQMRASVSRE